MTNLLFLDIEATGLDPEDRLVEVAYKTPDTNPICSYFKAPLPVKIAAMSVNNITNEMLEDKEPFVGSIYHFDLDRKSSDHVLVAHNAIYDLEMLKKEAISFPQHICTMKIAHYLDDAAKMEKHTLSYLRYYLETKVDANPHEATGDVLILEAVFNVLLDAIRVKDFLDSDEDCIRRMVEISEHPIIFKKFNFGKYEGQFLKDVAEGGSDGKGRDYMKWMLGEKMKNPVGQEADWIYTLNYYLNAYEPVKH